MKLRHYAMGQWLEGSGTQIEMHDASTGAVIATTSTEGLSVEEMYQFARTQGATALAKMTFHERARRLKSLALYLLEKKDKYYKVSAQTGATKVDSWIDIEGGIGNLFVMSSKGRREMPDTPFYVDGSPEILSKENTFLQNLASIAVWYPQPVPISKTAPKGFWSKTFP